MMMARGSAERHLNIITNGGTAAIPPNLYIVYTTGKHTASVDTLVMDRRIRTTRAARAVTEIATLKMPPYETGVEEDQETCIQESGK